ncbi:MAG: delta-60 repeat domain-containing protein, partial [Flavobacterium sp.]|nr:delta-60 repeat domain-containing protein [Flavobacterium sp.]
MVVYGNFNFINGTPLVRLARLNINGTLDNSLNINLSNQNAEAIFSVG